MVIYRPSLLIKRAALGNLKACFQCTHWHRFFPLKKALTLVSVFSPQERRGKTPPGAQNRYAIRLADHQRSRQIVRDGTAWEIVVYSCISIFQHKAFTY